MIRRYDEVLSDKANKTAIKEVYEQLRKFVTLDKVKELQAGMTRQFEEVHESQEQLAETLKLLNDQIAKDIHTAVRRATATLKA